MKRVFLSFAPEDAREVKKLLPQLACADYETDFYDVPGDLDFEQEKADAVKRAIGEKIVNSNVTVCLIGENTHKSKWADCQLRKSRNKGNKIIAMALRGIEYVVLPEVIREEYLKFYPWDPRRLKGLILETPARFPVNRKIA